MTGRSERDASRSDPGSRWRYLGASLASGLGFAVLDGLVNANPWAALSYELFTPIMRTSVDVRAGIAIDLLYGFVLAAIFRLLYRSLPGRKSLLKGVSFGILMWFFRVAMSVAGQWMMFPLSGAAVFYGLVAGLIEMLILGLVVAWALGELDG